MLSVIVNSYNPVSLTFKVDVVVALGSFHRYVTPVEVLVPFNTIEVPSHIEVSPGDIEHVGKGVTLTCKKEVVKHPFDPETVT